MPEQAASTSSAGRLALKLPMLSLHVTTSARLNFIYTRCFWKWIPWLGTGNKRELKC